MEKYKQDKKENGNIILLDLIESVVVIRKPGYFCTSND